MTHEAHPKKHHLSYSISLTIDSLGMRIILGLLTVMFPINQNRVHILNSTKEKLSIDEIKACFKRKNVKTTSLNYFHWKGPIDADVSLEFKFVK